MYSAFTLPRNITMHEAIKHFFANTGSVNPLFRESYWFLNDGPVTSPFTSTVILSQSCVLRLVCVVANILVSGGGLGLFLRGRTGFDEIITTYKGTAISIKDPNFKPKKTKYVWLAQTKDIVLDPDILTPGPFANYTVPNNARLSVPRGVSFIPGQQYTLTLKANRKAQSGHEVSAYYGPGVLEFQLALNEDGEDADAVIEFL